VHQPSVLMDRWSAATWGWCCWCWHLLRDVNAACWMSMSWYRVAGDIMGRGVFGAVS